MLARGEGVARPASELLVANGVVYDNFSRTRIRDENYRRR